MNVIIVEDEDLSAEHLAHLLIKIDKSIEVLGKFDTVKSVKEAFFRGLKVDLLFLDVHLADGSGFDLLSDTSISTPIIFTTAYDDYAIQAFKHNSIDYLLKPIHQKDLQFALEKYKNQQNIQQNVIIEHIKRAYQSIPTPYKTRFIVRLGQNIETIAVDQIHHFDSKESMSFLVTNNGQRYPIDYTLDQLETMLQPKDFFRINRRVILRFNVIGKVNTYFNGRLAVGSNFLEGDARIVSRERVNDFKLWMDDKI